MTTQINIQLLGAFDAQIDKTPLHFRSDKVKALLAYLLVNSGRTVRRETLATLLWPGYEDRRARKNLRDALFHLRKSIDAAIPDGSQTCLTTTRKTVTLDAAYLFLVDVLAIDQGTLSAELDAIPDGTFMAGFALADAEPFEEWLLLERLHWHGVLLDWLSAHAEQALDALNADQALAFAQRQLVLEPWREAAHRQAMRAYAQLGNFTALRRQYGQCVDTLRGEFGIEPTATTKQLLHSLTEQGAAQPQHNLPPELSPFTGRASELKRLSQALSRRDYRLFTLTGIGGSGKTRLALQLARQQIAHFQDGVWFVPLASADQREEAVVAIADVLGLRLSDERTLIEQLLDELRGKELLLVLDNLEQLLPAAADVVLALLQGCERLTIVATSRVALNLRVEKLFPLDGLALPERADAANLPAYDAVALFIEQAARVRMDPLVPAQFTAVARICRLLVGSPLAIELAAAQLARIPLHLLEQVLSQDITTLQTTMHDVPQRHRSLRAVFQYSWSLLSADQRGWLAMLSLFRQPFSPKAGIAVAGLAAAELELLTRASWLQRRGDGRYQLHKLLRQFAHEHLAVTTLRDGAERRFASYYLEFLQQQVALLDWDVSGAQIELLRTVRADIRYAWELASQQQLYAEMGESISALTTFYRQSGLSMAAVRLIDQLLQGIGRTLEATQSAELGRLIGRLYIERGWIGQESALGDKPKRELERGVELARRFNDDDAWIRGQLTLSGMLYRSNQIAAARQALEPIKARVLTDGSREQRVSLLVNISRIAEADADFVTALSYLRQAFALYDSDSPPLRKAWLMPDLAMILMLLGRHEEARPLLEEVQAVFAAAGWHHSRAIVLESLGELRLEQGATQEGTALLEESRRLYGEDGDIEGIANVEWTLAAAVLSAGRIADAETHYRQAADAMQQYGNTNLRYRVHVGEADIALARGEHDAAIAAVESLLPLLEMGKIRGEDLFRVYLTCYRVLDGVGDERATPLLETALSLLHAQAAKLESDEQRWMFMNNVRSHRLLLVAAAD